MKASSTFCRKPDCQQRESGRVSKTSNQPTHLSVPVMTTYLAALSLPRAEEAVPELGIEGVSSDAGSLLLAQVELGCHLLGWTDFGATCSGEGEGGGFGEVEREREGGLGKWRGEGGSLGKWRGEGGGFEEVERGREGGLGKWRGFLAG